MKLLPFKIHLSSPEERIQFQEALFSLGYAWGDGSKSPKMLQYQYFCLCPLYEESEVLILCWTSEGAFHVDEDRELTFNQFLKEVEDAK